MFTCDMYYFDIGSVFNNPYKINVDMKANKAPEKLYYAPYGDIRENHPITNEDIEYTRTDAFIEKACEWIQTNMDDYIYVKYDTVTGKPTNEAHIAHKKVVEDFINYMKGE